MAKGRQRHLPAAEAVGFGDILLHTSCGGVIEAVALAVDMKFMAKGVVESCWVWVSTIESRMFYSVGLPN